MYNFLKFISKPKIALVFCWIGFFLVPVVCDIYYEFNIHIYYVYILNFLSGALFGFGITTLYLGCKK